MLEYFQFPVLLLLLDYISEANIVLLLRYIYLKTLVTSYFVDVAYYYKTRMNHFRPKHFGNLKIAISDLQAHYASRSMRHIVSL